MSSQYIAIMFLSKRIGTSCIPPWFSTFPAYFIAGGCHCYIYGGMPCLLIHPGLPGVKVQQFLYYSKVLDKSTTWVLIKYMSCIKHQRVGAYEEEGYLCPHA